MGVLKLKRLVLRRIVSQLCDAAETILFSSKLAFIEGATKCLLDIKCVETTTSSHRPVGPNFPQAPRQIELFPFVAQFISPYTMGNAKRSFRKFFSLLLYPSCFRSASTLKRELSGHFLRNHYKLRQYVDEATKNVPIEVAAAIAKELVRLPQCMIVRLPLLAVFSSSVQEIILEDSATIPAALRTACVSYLQPGLTSIQFKMATANSLVEVLSNAPVAKTLKSLFVVARLPVDHWTGIPAEVISKFQSLESCYLYNGAADIHTARALLCLPKLTSVCLTPYHTDGDPTKYIDAIVELSTTLEKITLNVPNSESEFEYLQYAVAKFSIWEGRHRVTEITFTTDYGSIEQQSLHEAGIFALFPNLLPLGDTYGESTFVASVASIPSDQVAQCFSAHCDGISLNQELLDTIVQRMPSLTNLCVYVAANVNTLAGFGGSAFAALQSIHLQSTAVQPAVIQSWPQSLTSLGLNFTQADQASATFIADLFKPLLILKKLKTLNLCVWPCSVPEKELNSLLAKLSQLKSLNLNVKNVVMSQENEEFVFSHPRVKLLYLQIGTFVYGSLPSVTQMFYGAGKIRAGKSYLPRLHTYDYNDNSVHVEALSHCRELRSLKIELAPPPPFLRSFASAASSIRQLSFSKVNVSEADLSTCLTGFPRLWSLTLGGWHDNFFFPKISNLKWLKHPTLCQVSIFESGEDMQTYEGPISLSGADLPLLCQLTFSSTCSDISGITLENFDLLEGVYLDISSSQGVDFCIKSCAALRSFGLHGKAYPAKRLRRVLVEGVPQLETLSFESHNFPKLSATRIDAPKLWFSTISSFTKDDSISMQTLTSLADKWRAANPEGKFLLYPSYL
jgi:hypothetical protein